MSDVKRKLDLIYEAIRLGAGDFFELQNLTNTELREMILSAKE